MSLFAVALASLFLAIGSPAPQSTGALESIVGSYLQIHALLSADKLDGVKPLASSIASRAETLGAQGAPIAKAAKTLGAATDLKTTRDAFGPLSDAMIAALPPERLKELGVKRTFCPMVNRSWLQKDEKIRNPYYGSAMLDCGEFKK
jgi:hypothetical protein